MIDERFKDFDFWSNVLLIKAFFDKGMGLMNYFTKVLLIVGIGAVVQEYALEYVVIAGLLYAIFVTIGGYLWVKYKIAERESEISNRINPFQRQLREMFRMKKTYK